MKLRYAYSFTNELCISSSGSNNGSRRKESGKKKDRLKQTANGNETASANGPKNPEPIQGRKRMINMKQSE